MTTHDLGRPCNCPTCRERVEFQALVDAYRERDNALEALDIASSLPEAIRDLAWPKAAARYEAAAEALQRLDPRHLRGCLLRHVPVRDATCRCLPRTPAATKESP